MKCANICIIWLLIIGSCGHQASMSEVMKDYADLHSGISLKGDTVAKTVEQPAESSIDPMDVQLLTPQESDSNHELLLQYSSYVCSLNCETLTPRWVGWVLTRERINGNVKRKGFQADYDIPEEYRVEPSDYSNSAYDRGHMCPAADNKFSETAMMECSYMVNICPQDRNLNSGDWNELEILCRNWTKIYEKLYIVSGPIYDNDRLGRIGNRNSHKILVPTRFFKVVLVNDSKPKAIGFIMPNEVINRPLTDYVVSVDEVENITKLDFFSAIDDDIEGVIEAESDIDGWEFN